MSKKPVDLRRVESFGEMAAEDDAVLDYFLQTATQKRIEEASALLVLGRKGAGKTALVRYFAENDGSTTMSQALKFQSYPWTLHATRIDHGASPVEAYYASWELFIAVELSALVYKLCPNKDDQVCRTIAKFLKANYGTTDPSSADVLKPAKLRLEGTFEPEILGCKLGSLALTRDKSDLGLGSEITAVARSLLEAISFVAHKQLTNDVILLHLDELDQGLSTLDEARKQMLTGLVLAARSIRNKLMNAGLKLSPVIYLRTDLWEELQFSDKNKITEGVTIRIEWTEDDLRRLIERRASVRLKRTVDWDDLEDGALMRGSQAKWRHIVSRTYLRPRDMIKYCNEALKRVHARNEGPELFTNPDIIEARESYSPYLKRELDDEIVPHWKLWHEALESLSATQTLTFDVELFNSEYETRKSKDGLSAADALEYLFNFSVIGYERRSGYGGSGWTFKYQAPEARWDKGATRCKTHTGLKEYCKLKEDRQSELGD